MIKKLGIGLVLFVVAANFFLGFGYNFYRFDWFDTALHFLGGLGVFLIIFAYFQKDLLTFPLIKKVVILSSATITVGVIWEFAEYSFTAIPAILNLPWDGLSFIGDLPDTLSDLGFDTLGALVGFSILHFFRKRKPQ